MRWKWYRHRKRGFRKRILHLVRRRRWTNRGACVARMMEMILGPGIDVEKEKARADYADPGKPNKRAETR